jgi:ABC-2 type transport system ATP-binding protein
VIEIRGLTKRYGPVLAVDALSVDVRPGAVTGFLGPNGSGKSTTMRLILGLDSPDAGQARIAGCRYRDLRWPLREVGALLEAQAFHPGRSARDHLAALAASDAHSGRAGGRGAGPGRPGQRGLGAIIRHTAAAVAVLIGGVYVLAQVIAAIAHPLFTYVPISIVANSLSTTKPMGHGVVHMLPPWAGLGMLCLYAAVALGVGGWLLARRNA